MKDQPTALPRPRRRLLRTILKMPRKLRGFARRISWESSLAALPDPAEAAHWGEVILLEDFIVALHRDGTTSWLTHVVTCPHGDQNLADWDDVSQVFESRKSRTSIRRAAVYLPDGSKRKAQKAAGPISEKHQMVKLTYAPLRPGVVVELEMQDDLFVPDEVGPALWGNFGLQTQVPCRRRRITLAIAQPFAAQISVHHCAEQAKSYEHNGYQIHQWDLQNVDGIEADEWAPPARDYAPWLDFTTLPNWSPVARHFRTELTPRGRPQEPIQEMAGKLSEGATSDRDKLSAVYQYAARDVRYGRHPSEEEVRSSREPGKMVEDLRGDCKDKTSLMVSLLDQMGIPARIAVLLTAVNGRTPFLPSRRCDHAILVATVDGEDIWLDPAAGQYSFGDLPQNNQGVHAIILDNQQDRVADIPLDSPARQLVQRNCRGRLDENGIYLFEADFAAKGDRAAWLRNALLNRNEDHRRRTIQQYVAEDRTGVEVDEIQIEDVDDLNVDVRFRYRVKLRKWARQVEDLILFRIPWSEPIVFSGPLSAAERPIPIQMPQVARLIEKQEIQIPLGVKGYGLPFESKSECPWASYAVGVTCDGSLLRCERQVDYRSGIVPTEKFDELKGFWESCARADQADIVLIRNGN